MKKVDVARAWRDEEYRNRLSADVRAELPTHPAGIVDLGDDVLRSITGGCAPTQGPTTQWTSCVPPGSGCP